MSILIHPTYIPNIATFAAIVQNDVCWEVQDNFQKQTFRNRAYICTDRGKLMLNISIAHVGKGQGRQKYKDVKIDYDENWQRQHWRTLETAYRTSPYFEYYEDDIAPLYHQKHEFLLDFNLKLIKVVCNCLQIEMPTLKTNTFEVLPRDFEDFRFLADAKKNIDFGQKEYVQVFGDRHGFIENASILDLLFNEGTNALSYLNQINLKS